MYIPRRKGILFSTLMIRALLENRKNMTRRIAKGPHISDGVRGWWYGNLFFTDFAEIPDKHKAGYSPYKPGDKIWVKETHYAYGHWKRRDNPIKGTSKLVFVRNPFKDVYFADTLPKDIILCGKRTETGYFKRNSLFMPYALSRLSYTVTTVRAERLQDITEEDALAEGADPPLYADESCGGHVIETAVDHFSWIWDGLNAGDGHGWDVNPYVFAIKFQKPPEPKPLFSETDRDMFIHLLKTQF